MRVDFIALSTQPKKRSAHIIFRSHNKEIIAERREVMDQRTCIYKHCPTVVPCEKSVPKRQEEHRVLRTSSI